MRVGQQVQQYRLDHRLTTAALAALAGVSVENVRTMERGKPVGRTTADQVLAVVRGQSTQRRQEGW